MTLLSDYQARYSDQLRTNWSNPQDSAPTTPDTAAETLAAADAQADFEAICGSAYVSTNATHVSAGVPLVVAKLQVYTGQADETYYDKALDRCRNIYRLVLGRNRIVPTTDSTLKPTTDQANQLPWSDRQNFIDYIGNAPDGENPSIGTPGGAGTD